MIIIASLQKFELLLAQTLEPFSRQIEGRLILYGMGFIQLRQFFI